jgi:hypothetical protein
VATPSRFSASDRASFITGAALVLDGRPDGSQIWNVGRRRHRLILRRNKAAGAYADVKGPAGMNAYSTKPPGMNL